MCRTNSYSVNYMYTCNRNQNIPDYRVYLNAYLPGKVRQLFDHQTYVECGLEQWNGIDKM